MSDIATKIELELLSVTGAAAESFLQRMLSNQITGMPEDQVCPAFLLEATGRIVSGGFVFRDDENFLIICAAGWREKMRLGLEKYRIADQVEFQNDNRSCFLVHGPADVQLNLCSKNDGVIIGDLGTDKEEVTHEQRIEAGVPWFGYELTEKTIPIEAGMYAWLSNTKGCYVGQEVVERMWSRDRMARRLVRIGCEQAMAVSIPFEIKGKHGRGQVTSLVEKADNTMIGLGYYSDHDEEIAMDTKGQSWRIQQMESP